MQHDSKVGITPLLHLDKLMQCTADERGRLRIVLPIGENGVAQKLVDHAAGGFDRIPAQPQPSANPQAEGVGVQLPAHGGVAFDIHHEQPANRLSPHDHGRRRFCCDERRRRLSFQAEDEGFAQDVNNVAILEPVGNGNSLAIAQRAVGASEVCQPEFGAIFRLLRMNVRVAAGESMARGGLSTQCKTCCRLAGL